MAQPAPAPMITPSQTIRIKNQEPDQESVTINVGDAVEIHNEDNTPYEMPISYLDDGSDEDYPLALYLPAGGKLYLIGAEGATCSYFVNSVSSASSLTKPGPDTGPYTIIVNSGAGSKGGEK